MPTPIAPAAPPVDDFANAFIEAVNSDNPAAKPAEPAPAAPAAPAPAPADKPAEGGPAPGTETDQIAENAENTGEQAPETGEKPPEIPPKQPEIESNEAKMARLEAENAALKAPKPVEIEAPPAPQRAEKAPETPENAAPAAPRDPVWYAFEPEESKLVEQYKKDWPDVAAATEVLVKQAAFNAVEYMFDTLRKQILPRLNHFDEMSNVFAERLTLDTLQRAHPDYDAIYDGVVSWVDTLPAAFKHGAKQVMATGTPDEVAELIATYKASVTPKAPDPKSTTELSAAAKQAASKLRVVGSKRTTPVAGADPNDFDAAWEEANRAG
jgi:hypothetical protein